MKILATAYAINPYKGSEDGTGWNLTYQIARYNKVIAITRKNNQEHIEKYIAENPDEVYENMQFAYFDLPYWARFWKKGGRGAMLYFYLWRMFIPFFIKKQKFEFDVVHALNFHNDWAPSFLWIFGKPMVWGPIGHHPIIPKGFVKDFYGWKASLKNKLNWLIKQCFWNLDPFLKITKWKTDHIIGINSSIKSVLKIKDENKLTVLPAVASENTTFTQVNQNETFNILTIGRFEPIKGMDVGLEAFAKFYHQLSKIQQSQIQYNVIGKGPYKKELKALCDKLKIKEVVNFIEWMPRAELTKIYEAADVYLFSSHEGAGMVIPEALSYGIPVICFDNCGPGELTDNSCAIKVKYKTYTESVNDFAASLKQMFANPKQRLTYALNARKYYLENFTWNRKGNIINDIYNKITSDAKTKNSMRTSSKRLQREPISAV